MDTVLELMEDAVARYDRKPFLLIRPGFRTRITRYRDLGRIVPAWPACSTTGASAGGTARSSGP